MKIFSVLGAVLDRISIKDAVFAFSIGNIEWNMSFAVNEDNLIEKHKDDGFVILATTQAEKPEFPFGFQVVEEAEEDEE